MVDSSGKTEGRSEAAAAKGEGRQGKQAAVPTADVLIAEYGLFWDGDPPADERDYRVKAFANGQSALCLSGGGIRSAAFGLGVMQALNEKGLLTRFHYLSTVSGGGYIGSWLQRWIHEKGGDAAAVSKELDDDDNPSEIKALRAGSNYLTPRVGLASNDTWTAIAITIRNIATNWLLFGPLLLLVALFPNLFYNSVTSIAPRAFDTQWLFFVPLGFAFLSAGLAGWFSCRAFPSYRAAHPSPPGAGDTWLTLRIVLPLVLWAIAGTLIMSVEVLQVKLWTGPLQAIWPWNWTYPRGGLLAVATFLGLGIGFVLGGVTRGTYVRTFARDLFVGLFALAAAVSLIPIGVQLFDRISPTDPDLKGLLLTTLAPLWLLGTQLIGTILFVAFRTSMDPLVQPDADREWLARLSAVKIKIMLLWALVASTALLLNHLLDIYARQYDMSLSALIAIVTGTTAVSGGRSPQTGKMVKEATSWMARHLPLSTIISVATFVFAGVLLLMMSRLERLLITPLKPLLTSLPKWADASVVAHYILFLVLLVVVILLGRQIQVNRFSLNGLYRNRLARTFLGGARRDREPDRFTGFDAQDNVRLNRLAPQVAGKTVLYPVINVALNVTASENLAWQERKAEPFVFTPKYCGSALLDPGGAPAGLGRGAFILTEDYGGNEPDLAMPGWGVSLATAMSISGAAASPNMGYHSSPATAFLMTLFNVRLGAWLPNPARAEKLGDLMGRSGPRNSLGPLIRELGGSSNDLGLDVYLSDGGHFENLGLYEMVLRRCRFIVVSDAGSDPDCAFTDLGNAVRKVKIDLGVRIDFAEMHISSRTRPIKPQRAWALGDISYPEGGVGKILYIKPSFFGRELPVDVVSYAADSASFPHESTGDQFFSESQFESYRKLGHHLASEIGGKRKGHKSMAGFFRALGPHAPAADDEKGLKERARRWLGLEGQAP